MNLYGRLRTRYNSSPAAEGIQYALKPIWIKAPELRACTRATQQGCPIVAAHHGINGPDTGRNSRGKAIKKMGRMKMLQ